MNDYLDGWLMKICGRMIVAMIRSATSAAGKTFVCKMLRRILVGKGNILQHLRTDLGRLLS